MSQELGRLSGRPANGDEDIKQGRSLLGLAGTAPKWAALELFCGHDAR
jgi:hypothetical protein